MLPTVTILLFSLALCIDGGSSRLTARDVAAKLENYDKTLPPSTNSTKVEIGWYVNSVKMDEDKGVITLDIYLRQSWVDPRLDFGSRSSVRIYSYDTIWIPDLFIRNDRSGSMCAVPAGLKLLRVSRKGAVWYVMKTTIEASCPMHYGRYPKDAQTCYMPHESFGYTADILHLRPMSIPIDIDTNLTLPQFRLLSADTSDCSQNYTTGSYPCLMFAFTMRRTQGWFFFTLVYLPTTIIVLVSSSAFWINVDKVAARLIVGLSTSLTMSVYTGISRAFYPPPAAATYFTLLDVWLTSSVVIVFLAFILQLAAVVSAGLDSKDNSNQEEQKATETSSKLARLRGGILDLVGKILVPALLLLLIIVYAAL